MLIDCQVKPSRLRVACCLAVNMLVLLLLLFAGVPLVFKVLLMLLFSAVNLAHSYAVYRGRVGTYVQHVWQVNRCEWFVHSVHNPVTQAAELLSIDFRGFAVALRFRCDGQQYRLTLWKDQVNQAEWRKLSVLARLQQTAIQSVF